MIKVLFISRRSERCGVADYGKRVYDVIKRSAVLDVTFHEVDGPFNFAGYDVLLINYHHATLPFITDMDLRGIKAAVIHHEGPMNIHPDTVLYTHIRPLFEDKYFPIPTTENQVPVIGSFGFGFPDKDFPRVAHMVREQFKRAVLRLNIPFAEFGDADGALARAEVEKVKAVLSGSSIGLQVSHDFVSHDQLLYWLRDNDLNLFLYKPSHGRGLSSTIDYALSARRPIGVSSSEMFRHLPEGICVDNVSLPGLIRAGIQPLFTVYEQHSNANLIVYYEKVITELCRQ